MLELTLTGWVLAVVAAIAVGLAKGGLSMLGIMAVPLLALVMSPVQAAGLLLPVFVISDIGGLIAFRRNFDLRVLASSVPGSLLGIALGWATAQVMPVWVVTLIVGIISVAFSLDQLIRRRVSIRPRDTSYLRGGFWGALAGYTSFVSHAGAPPYQIYVQPLHLPTVIYAGTTTWFFAVTNWVKLIPYAMLGQLSLANLKAAAVLTPVALIAVWVGLRLVRIIPQQLFYRLITWGLLMVGLRLIWQALAG